MQHRFSSGIRPQKYKQQIQSNASAVIDISSGEPIPGRLLLSRARFRFSSLQNSFYKTIFTICLKSQPPSERIAE